MGTTTITPSFQPAGFVSVRLYYTAAELADYFDANDGDNNDISAATAFNEIAITRYSGANEDCKLDGNDGGGAHMLVPQSLISHGTFAPDYFIQFETDNFSEFYLHGNSPKPLPIELFSFTGKVTSTGNHLEWVTASETNTSHFEIVRSMDGINFRSIGRVEAAGNSQERISYSLLDGFPFETTYYKIKIVDRDETVSYSHVIVLKDDDFQNEVQIVPNPTSGKFELIFNSISDSELTVRIYSSLGQLIHEKIISSGPENHIQQLDLSGHSPGVYVVEFSDANLTPRRIILSSP